MHIKIARIQSNIEYKTIWYTLHTKIVINYKDNKIKYQIIDGRV